MLMEREERVERNALCVTMGSMAEEVRVRWCVGLMGAMAGRKIRRSQSSSVRRGCLGSSHVFFCEMVFDVHTRCGSL